jgi:hypothetical protein
MNKEVMVTLGVIAYHHGAKLLNGCCEDIQKGCLEHFLLNQLEVIKQLFGKERKYIFILITQLLFDM